MRNPKGIIFLIAVSLMNISCLDKIKKGDRVCIDGHCVNVEIVQKKVDMERGLQNRESLDENAGMLFIFSKSAKHSFWMEKTLIPLDMIWINHYQEIVYIEENATPCKIYPCTIYTPTREALYVLEVNAGYVAKKGIKVGDRADFKIKSKSK